MKLDNVETVPGRHGHFSAGPRKRLTVRLATGLAQQLAAEAAELGLSENKLLARIVRNYFERYKP